MVRCRAFVNATAKRYDPRMKWFKLALVGIAAFSIFAFTVQNSSRTTQLSLDIGVAAWKLMDPAPIPMLMWACFVLGAVMTWAAGMRRNLVLARRVRQLEQEMALAGKSATPKDGGWG